MAKGTNAIGKFRGKAGAMVFRVVDGKQVMQEYNPNPRKSSTYPQMAQRTGMRAISQIGSALLAPIRLGFSTRYYPFSWFVKENLKHNVVSATGPESVEINYGMLKIAEDTIHRNTVVQPGAVDYGEGQHLTVKVPFTVASEVPTSDLKVVMALYAPDLELGIMSQPVAVDAGNVTVQLPTSWDGITVHVYVFVFANAGSIDPDAVDVMHARLPYYTSASVYGGNGDVQ
jgi:hypothetical protein